MEGLAKEVAPALIEEELRQSYLDYAMSVIVSRALPDVRDGLKPVHRRILHAMRELGNGWDKPHKKSARVVGDVIGKYHPHGESAVYTSIVRMAQPFAMRYTLVEGQGNFGSIDGDAPAAMRYTEVRMERITEELLADIDKETVDFVPNYDNTESIPEVLPARLPNLLVNGSSGIAVGLATNIPPHNLGETLRAALALLDNPGITVKQLMKHLPGPDFPTGAIINGHEGIEQAYHHGRGRVVMRSRASISSIRGGREAIIVTELPYQVNKARLVEQIAALVREKKISGISELRDESDKDGIRVVIELRRGEIGMVVLNNLYKQTAMQSSFGINMVALCESRPRLLDLKEVLNAFLGHRREVITRRTLFLLRKARVRTHLLEGLSIAVDNIDEVVKIIRNSATTEEARAGLMKKSWSPAKGLSELLDVEDRDSYRPADLSAEYGVKTVNKRLVYRLSPQQAKGILELRLQRLTGLEQDKIRGEYADLTVQIRDYLGILSGQKQLQEVLKEELQTLLKEHGDERRTEIQKSQAEFSPEDLIPNQDRVVTLTHGGYVTSQVPGAYRTQKRGGIGTAVAAVKDDDVIEQIMVARAHDTLLCFSSWGKVYWLRVYDIPTVGRNARGRPLPNLLDIGDGERISAVLPIKDFDEDRYVFMSTERATVKRIPLSAFSNPMSKGVRALTLAAGDRLVAAQLVDDEAHMMLFSTAGMTVRFAVKDVRPTGRAARGVIGMNIAADGKVVAALVPKEGGGICTVTQKGYGKCTNTEEFRLVKRGAKGIIAQRVEGRNGPLVGATQVFPGDEFMLVSDQGTAVRLVGKDIPVLSRATSGVRLISLRGDDEVAGIARIVRSDDALEALSVDDADNQD